MEKITQEGNYSTIIVDAKLIKHRFEPAAGYEVKLTGKTSDDKVCDVYLAITQKYIQNGNNSGKQEMALSMETLQFLGLPGNDLSQIKTLINRPMPVFAQTSKSGYLVFYVSKISEEEVDPTIVMRMFQAVQAVQPFQQPLTDNPFA